MVARLPALLRTYIGAASAACGDYQNADLLKIHVTSGKLTLIRFDDFAGQPLPRMLERVKIKLREQVLDPVIDWFGMIRLTYGFRSPALARAIRARGGGPIDPKRDQHAAHEHNRLGNQVCERVDSCRG